MPLFHSCICRIRKPLFLALLLAFSVHLGFSQTVGRVENVQKDNVLPLVSGVLKAHHTGLLSVETDTHDLLSNYEEFRSHLMQYRARYRFHLDGSTLQVTMDNLEVPGHGVWNHALIPADGAEAKLIAKIVDELNAANQNFASSPSPANSSESVAPIPPSPAATPKTVAAQPAVQNSAQSGLHESPKPKLAARVKGRNPYLGKWQNLDHPEAGSFEITPNGEGYLLKVAGQRLFGGSRTTMAPATMKDGYLQASGAYAGTTLTYIKDTDSLLISSAAGSAELQRVE